MEICHNMKPKKMPTAVCEGGKPTPPRHPPGRPPGRQPEHIPSRSRLGGSKIKGARPRFDPRGAVLIYLLARLFNGGGSHKLKQAADSPPPTPIFMLPPSRTQVYHKQIPLLLRYKRFSCYKGLEINASKAVCHRCADAGQTFRLTLKLYNSLSRVPWCVASNSFAA